MKHLAFVILCLYLTSCTQANNTKPICDDGKVAPPRTHGKFSQSRRFIIAGQSNGSSLAQNHPWYYSQTGLTYIIDDADGMPRGVPTEDGPIRYSIAWIYLGDMIGGPVLMHNVSHGNQTSTRWKNIWIHDLLNALQDGHYDAVLWVQGESDIAENIPYDETCSNLKYMIQESQKIQPDLDWYIALDSYINQPDDNHVRRAERAVIAQGWAMQGPDTDTIRLNPNWVESGGAEFVGDGLQKHAQLWYDAIKDRL